MKTVTVFGSSSILENSENWKVAEILGKLLASLCCDIKTGGYCGVF
jgi:predicted Rossmann-fold nucleotide-binding protein